jgi:hypothetical protein
MGDFLWLRAVGWLSGPGQAPLVCALAGLLGAVVNCALEDQPLVLPCLRGNRLELGFLGNLAACAVVAEIADHDFETAFLAALCGTVILRAFKGRMERIFEEERGRRRGRR